MITYRLIDPMESADKVLSIDACNPIYDLGNWIDLHGGNVLILNEHTNKTIALPICRYLQSGWQANQSR